MELPATFGSYQLLERIATGGMAEVFLARSFGVEGFEKRLVIKRILPQLARSPHFVQLFVREAKISSLLHHPNIVQVFDLGRVGEDHYIAMEHIHGRDLTRTLRRVRGQDRHIPLALALHVTAAVARGLAYAHTRTDATGKPTPIVHRDVSPHNVILSFLGEVKLVDFGIARLASELKEEGERSGPGGGKFAYMSPEQASGGMVDHRSDIFSCGIVLWEMLAGRRLFQADDGDEKLRLVREAIVPDLRALNDEVPEALMPILARALAKDPADRYPSAALLEEDLRALLFELGLRVDSASVSGFLRDLFAEELGPDPGVAQLQSLAAELSRMEVSGPDTGSTHSETTGGARGRVLGEKKTVAVVVAELVGLTDASAVVEPEEVLHQQDVLMRAVRKLADRYDGWLDDFTHDTFTLLFGVPRAHEDDTDRALACAQDLLRVTERLRKKGHAMELAVAVHRGEVALSGTEEELRYVPRGNTLKLARRLVSLAEPGDVHVSNEVASQAGERWRFTTGPRVRMKGRREELATFYLAGRRRRALGGAQGRWVRRADELEQLATGISGLADGRGGLIAIRGPAGTGKSRLVRELRRLTRRARVPLFAARAYPYGHESPLAPFRDLVGSALGIDPREGSGALRQRLLRMHELGLAESDIAHLSALFGVRSKAWREPSREDIFAAGARFVRGVAAERPVLLVLEDLQFLKPPERALLGHLVRSSAESRVLWLVTARGKLPEQLPEPTVQIALGTLERNAVGSLVKDLLGAQEVDEPLLELVGGLAQGNALYVAEVLKALQERQLIDWDRRRASLRDGEQAVPVLPATLEGLVTSRIDALDPASKGALQLAATIGPSFSPALVAEAAGLEDPGPIFADLAQATLIVDEESSESCRFASEMVWQVVRRSILGVQLRDHHRMVAAGMERLYKDRLAPHYEALAGHCAAGGRLADAAWYASKAGDQHRSGAFLTRALATYRKGISWLEAAVDGGEDPALHSRGEATLHLKAGEVAWLLGQHRDAERHLVVAMDIAADAVIQDVETRCFLALGKLYAVTGREGMAQVNLEQALSEARRTRDTKGQVSVLTELASLRSDAGNYAACEALLGEAMELAGDQPQLAAMVQLGLGSRFIRDDRPELAWQPLEAARALAEGTGDRILLGRIENNLGLARHGLGDYAAALKHFRRALELRRGTGYRRGLVINLHNIGDANLRLEQYGHAHAAFTESLELAQEAGLNRSVALNRAYLGYLEARRGDPGEGLAQIRRAHKRARALGDGQTAVAARWLEGRVLLEQGNTDSAKELLAAALKEAKETGAHWIARDIESDLL
ncbi:MAG: protein kinase [Myxococcota bacterium]|nr:protein kinase [Myxococcota bacterium]